MTPAEAAALLTVCAGFDNRKPDADAAKAWSLALDDLRYEDCRAAVVKHYATKRDWVMPADIRDLVRRVRSKRIADDEHVDPPAWLDPDDTGAYARWLANSRRDLAEGRAVAAIEGAPCRVRDVRALGEVGTSVRDQERAAARARIAASRAAQKAAPELLLSPSEHSREPQRRTTTEHDHHDEGAA